MIKCTRTLEWDEFFGFFDDKVLVAAFHRHDLSTEWRQIKFLIKTIGKHVDFSHLEWYDDNRVRVVGFDKHQTIDLDCKLLNYQFGMRMPLDRQLQLTCEEE